MTVFDDFHLLQHCLSTRHITFMGAVTGPPVLAVMRCGDSPEPVGLGDAFGESSEGVPRGPTPGGSPGGVPRPTPDQT